MALSIEDRLDAIEKKMIEIEAKQGTIKLSPQIWAVIFTTLGIVWGAATLVVFLQFNSMAQSVHISEIEQKLTTHIVQEGHPVGLERLRSLDARVSIIEEEHKHGLEKATK